MRLIAKLLLVLLWVPMLAIAQSPHEILRSLDAYKQTNGVLVRWVIKGGDQCQGIRIFRSLDEENFKKIGEIDGVCGSTDGDETYSYFDADPVSNHYNHYQLELGAQGFTDVVTVFFEDFGKQNYALLSDYQNNSYKILFSNDLKNKAVLEVFDRMGNAIYGDSSTDSDVEFNTSGWGSGFYIFRISGVSETYIHGKLYIRGQ